MIMNKQQMIRHGDALLIPISEIPNKAKDLQTDILLAGEATGHHHRFAGHTQILQYDKTKYVNVSQQTDLTHEEHKTVPVTEGLYKLVIEQEFDPFERIIQRVRD